MCIGYFLQAPIAEILIAMAADPRLEHISLPTGGTLQYERVILSKYAIPLAPYILRHETLRFIPMLQFLDSTHVAKTSAYLALMQRHKFKRGDFTEVIELL